MHTDIHLYEGKEPFVFISYAHKDAAKAEAVMQWLNDNNYRIWFDKGIHSGEFASKIEERLENASCLIALLTDNYIDSINCRNEINFAIKNRITILPICLEPTQLRHGMNLQLVSYHFIYRYQLTESAFYEKLKQSPEIQGAYDETGENCDNTETTGEGKRGLGKNRVWVIGLACLLIGVLCLVAFWPGNTDQMNIRNEYSNLTAYDEELIVEEMVKTWKPLAHLGYDVTIEETLSHLYDTVAYDKDTVTAQNGEYSIAFSVSYRINADGSYSVDDYGETIFYNCYINGTAVAPEDFERFMCALITAAEGS